MTSYQGGKKRIGKKLHDAIYLVEEDLYGDHDAPYFEPFVGMAGVMRHFGADGGRRLLACDKNEDIILLWQAVQRGWKPPRSCSKEKFNRLKNSETHSAERGFIGCAASWGGNFFQSYRVNKRNGSSLIEGKNGLEKIKPDIENVNFLSPRSYTSFKPKNMTIYCDPPYIGNNLGGNNSFFQTFDHERFWNKMREWDRNNLVFISEWEAPRDFKKVYSTQSYVSNNNNTKRYSDNLYVHEDLYKEISPSCKRIIKKI